MSGVEGRAFVTLFSQGKSMRGTAASRMSGEAGCPAVSVRGLRWIAACLLACPLGGYAHAWQAQATKPAAGAAAPAAAAKPAEGDVVEVDVVEIDVIETAQAPPELVEAVRKAEALTVEAFNKGDAEGLSKLFMEKGELVDENGNVFAGREQIAALFKGFFEKFPKANLQMQVTGVRTVGDSLAIEEGVRLVTVPDADSAAQVRYVAVRDKVGDQWPIATYSEFADDPPPTPAEMLSAVSFLVGDWVDESPEGKTTISYRFEDDGNFIVGDYTLASQGAPESRSHQRIGWDPLEGVLRSWTFDSDGGFSTGEWVPTEAGWVVKTEATMPDGTTGSATVTLVPVDDDHFIVRSSDRIVGGVDEPEFELRIARQPPAPGAAVQPSGAAAPATGAPAPAVKPAASEGKPVQGTPAGSVESKPAVPSPAPTVKPAVPAVPATPAVPGKPAIKIGQ